MGGTLYCSGSDAETTGICEGKCCLSERHRQFLREVATAPTPPCTPHGGDRSGKPRCSPRSPRLCTHQQDSRKRPGPFVHLSLSPGSTSDCPCTSGFQPDHTVPQGHRPSLRPLLGPLSFLPSASLWGTINRSLLSGFSLPQSDTQSLGLPILKPWSQPLCGGLPLSFPQSTPPCSAPLPPLLGLAPPRPLHPCSSAHSLLLLHVCGDTPPFQAAPRFRDAVVSALRSLPAADFGRFASARKETL